MNEIYRERVQSLLSVQSSWDENTICASAVISEISLLAPFIAIALVEKTIDSWKPKSISFHGLVWMYVHLKGTWPSRMTVTVFRNLKMIGTAPTAVPESS